MQELEQMLVNRIREFSYDVTVYRYQVPSELIMVFKNEDAKHTMEYVDNIRHVVAASEFIFTNGKNIKITISASVSEKTRLDLNALPLGRTMPCKKPTVLIAILSLKLNYFQVLPVLTNIYRLKKPE